VTDQPDPTHRRRRRRATSAQGAPAPQAAAPQPTTPHPPAQPPAEPARAPRRARPNRDNGDGGMRDLVGAGHSQVSVGNALRARDLNRPTDEDLAEAEATVVIVRRHWQPTQ
jgi:hypothetical protein